jgi:hypothetical protein
VSDFDDVIDADVQGAERERLRGVHELLVAAGPPPELPDSLLHAPRPGEVRALRPRMARSRTLLIAAAIIVVGITFTLGFATGQKHAPPPQALEKLALRGTSAAPHARGTLALYQQQSGNWPMTLTVSGLPRVKAPTYYIVWLIRDGKTVAPCGQFVVAKSGSSLTLNLSAPYALKRGDSWVVTRATYSNGPTVIRRGYRPAGGSRLVMRPA